MDGQALKAWFTRVPFATRALAALLIGLHALSLLAPRAWRFLCMSPRLSVVRLQVWRVVTAPVWHASFLHLALNVAALLALGPDLERSIGSVRLLHLVAVLALAAGLIHAALAYALAFLVGLRGGLASCAIGFSGVLFGLAVVDSAATGPQLRTVLGRFELPGALLPWLGILAVQALVPHASFLGHLAGLLAGEAWARGCLARLALRDADVAAAEAHPRYVRDAPRVGPCVAGTPGAPQLWEAVGARCANGGGSGSSLEAAGAVLAAGASAAWARVPPPTREQAQQHWHRARLFAAEKSRALGATLPAPVAAALTDARASLVTLASRHAPGLAHLVGGKRSSAAGGSGSVDIEAALAPAPGEQRLDELRPLLSGGARGGGGGGGSMGGGSSGGNNGGGSEGDAAVVVGGSAGGGPSPARRPRAGAVSSPGESA